MLVIAVVETQPILNFDSLCNDTMWIISVPDRSWETRLHAVDLIMEQSSEIGFYDWYDYFSREFPWWAIGRIALTGYFYNLRKHEVPPWEEDPNHDCLCEDEGWWCHDANGPEWTFFGCDRAVVDETENALCRWMWTLDEDYC